MAKKETVSEFFKNLSKFPSNFNTLVIRDWNAATLEAQGYSRDKAPVASGTYRANIKNKKAKITQTGVESSIYNLLPYARFLELSRRGRGSGKMILKNPGEISYYADGKKIKKQKRGEYHAIHYGIAEVDFIKALDDTISRAWNYI